MADFPDRYLLFNSYSSKNLNVVVEIDGVGTFFSSSDLFTRIKYGDVGIDYGDPDLVYGGLRRLTSADGSPGFESLLSLDGSSLTISQRLEPEQGRASVSQFTLAFIDTNQEFSRIISPGVVVDEILGRAVTVRLGYIQTSYPEDYFIIFRGIISQVSSLPGLVQLQFSDANIRRRQQVFYTATTTLSSGIDAVTTTIPVTSNGDFHQQILGPDGNYDSSIKTYLKIGDEWIEYPSTGFGTNEFTSVTRGARGSVADSHDVDDDVTATVQIEGHVIDIALKLMLSGWAGNWLTDVPLFSLAQTTDPILAFQENAIILPEMTNADEDYGLVVGDYITISGASNLSNNQTVRIIDFGDLFGTPNRIIYTDGVFIAEVSTSAVAAFRSQYDTFPTTCGMKLRPFEVDIQEHLDIKNLFLVGSENNMRFFIQERTNGKEFLESQCYLPTSCYSLTRYGRMSIGITKPPIANERLQYLTKDNVLDPERIAPNRGMNNRKFFNEIQFYWDENDDGQFRSAIKFLDSESLTLIGITSTLPISSKGGRTDLGTNTQFERRAAFLLSRYKRGAVNFYVTVNWEVGSLIEAGDVVALVDNGFFKITNFQTGERNIGVQLFEVQERSLDIKTGQIRLWLVAGIGAEATDRFGTISPSSDLDNGSTESVLVIKDSYGAIFPNNESRKWKDYIDNNVIVHDESWSFLEESTLIGIDPTNRYKLIIDPPLSVAPPSGYIVDIPYYPTGENPLDSIIYKSIHAFIDPQVTASSGISDMAFQVPPGDIDKFFVGGVIRVHDYAYVFDSGDVQISAVDPTGYTIYTQESLGSTPTGGASLVDLIGFSYDRGGAYRFI